MVVPAPVPVPVSWPGIVGSVRIVSAVGRTFGLFGAAGGVAVVSAGAAAVVVGGGVVVESDVDCASVTVEVVAVDEVSVVTGVEV